MLLPYIVIIPFCQGLVAGDKETSTARLIYFAAPEYLRAPPDLFDSVHLTIIETYLSYPNYYPTKALLTSRPLDLK